LISKYYDTITTRSGFARVTHTMERNLGQQLLFLGVTMNCFEKLFSSLLESTKEKAIALKDAIALLDLCEDFPETISRPILVLSLFSAQLSTAHLTYDSRCNIYVDELIVFDYDFNPLIHLFPKDVGNEPLPAPSTSRRKRSNSTQTLPSHYRRYSSLPIIELHENITSLNKTSSINITLLIRDSKHPWGKDGSASFLFPPPLEKVSMISELKIEIENLDLLFTPSSIPTILNSFLPLVEDLSRKFLISNADLPSTPVDAVPSTSRNINLKFDCIHSVLMSENRDYFAECIVSRVQIDHLPKRKTVDLSAPCLVASIHTVELFDLSVAGNLHPSILTRVQSGSGPMIQMEMTLTDDKDEISFQTDGARLCLVTRFLNEFQAIIFQRFFPLIRPEIDSYLLLLNTCHPSYSKLITEVLCGDTSFSSKSNHLTLHLLTFLAKYFPPIKQFLKSLTHSSSLPTLLISAELFDTILIIPRGSTSHDIVGICVDQIVYHRLHVNETWNSLSKTFIENERECLYFESSSNSWKWSTHHPKESSKQFSPTDQPTVAGVSDENYSETVFIPQPTSSSESDLSPNSTVPFKHSILSKLFNDLDSSEDDEEKTDEKTYTDFINLDTEASDDHQMIPTTTTEMRIKPELILVSPNRSVMKRVSINVEDLGSDSESHSSDDQFFDTQMAYNSRSPTVEDENGEREGEVKRPVSSHDPIKHSALHKLYNAREEDTIIRHEFSLENISLFVSLETLEHTQGNEESCDTIYRRYLPISSESSVYSEVRDYMNSATYSAQQWKQVSIRPFDCLALCDIVDNKLRLLFSDLPYPSSLHLNLSLAEYYLLLSLYYENSFEEPQFPFVQDPIGLSSSSSSSGIAISLLGPYPTYGTKEYLEYLRGCSYQTEIHAVRGEILLDLTMSPDTFGDKIPSFSFLSEDLLSDTDLPFANIHLKWLSCHCLIGEIAKQAAFGIGELILTDVRSLDRAHGAHTIRLSQNIDHDQHSLSHGFADFDYGLQLTSTLLSSEATLLPFQGVFFEITQGWKTALLGLQEIDVDIQNFELFLLFFDYFSLYHTNSVFGNPCVHAKLSIETSAWPITGIDLRLFFVKPHIQFAESPLQTANSLIIEADDGLSLRLISDHQSWDIQMSANNLAVGLVKSYQTSTATIGLRGTAGSGLGIRTILDETNFIFSYHFNHSLLHSDMQLRAFPRISILSLGGDDDDDDYFTSNAHLYSDGVLSVPTLPSGGLPVGVDESSWDRVAWSSCSQIVLSSDDFATLKSFFRRCLMIDEMGRPTIVSGILPVQSLLFSPDISLEFHQTSIFSTVQVNHLQLLIVDNILGLHLPLIQVLLYPILCPSHHSRSIFRRFILLSILIFTLPVLLISHTSISFPLGSSPLRVISGSIPSTTL
jgi:hypothetical protein